MEFDEKWMPKGHRKSAKIDAFGAPGADLGDFFGVSAEAEKMFHFDEFLAGQKVAKISRIWIFLKKVL